MPNSYITDSKNEVIAVFDGYVLIDRTDDYCLIKNGMLINHYELKYHESWDALMPVWGKVGKILFEMRCDLNKEHYIQAHMFTKMFLDACQSANIEEAHAAVYNIIVLLNKYKSTC